MENWNEEIEGEVFIYSQGVKKSKWDVMLMAGIHPEEEAGIFCLQEMINDTEWLQLYGDINVIVIPCRNKAGFHIRTYLEDSKTYNGRIVEDSPFYKMMMTSKGCIVLIKKEMWKEKDRNVFWNRLKNAIGRVMTEGFVHIISLKKNQDIRANTYYYKEKKLIDSNVIDECPKTDFICDIKSLIEKYKPDFLIDVHEGKGNEAYIYVDSKDEEMISNGRHLISCLESLQIPIRRKSEDRRRISDGIFALEDLKSGRMLIDAAGSGKVMVLESGIELKREDRIEVLKKMIEQSMIYEWRKINGKACDSPYNQQL